jgi:epoxyqueuosine reductase
VSDGLKDKSGDERRRESTTTRDTVRVKRRAMELGFDAVGIASLQPSVHAAALDRWLAAGYGGEMQYLGLQAARRKDPGRLMPGARVAVVTLSNYCHEVTPETTPRRGAKVAQYAWSRDYHRVVGTRLSRLARVITEIAPRAQTRSYVDAGPVPERELAQRAGLGWIGKNTMLIDPRRGSFTFIGVVLTDADLVPDPPFEADRCGTCRRCLDACPTNAFVEPYVLDARRCISYLTIERRGPFTEQEAPLVADWLFGCDVCQDVCPWNVTFARPAGDAELAPRPELRTPDLALLAEVSPADFTRQFGDTAFERPGVAGMRRNAAAVKGNSMKTE